MTGVPVARDRAGGGPREGDRPAAGRRRARRLVAPDDLPEAGSPAELLEELALAVVAQPDARPGLAAGRRRDRLLPDPTTVHLVRRRLRLRGRGPELTTLLDALLEAGVTRYDPSRRAELLEGGVLVDVDFCATQHAHNTGIQRVVRQTMRRWVGGRPVTLAAWSRRRRGSAHAHGGRAQPGRLLGRPRGRAVRRRVGPPAAACRSGPSWCSPRWPGSRCAPRSRRWRSLSGNARRHDRVRLHPGQQRRHRARRSSPSGSPSTSRSSRSASVVAGHQRHGHGGVPGLR